MDYFKKRKKEDFDEKPVNKALDDVEKLKIAQKMWDEFEYKYLLEIPPSKKPCFLAGTMVKTEKGLVAIEKIEQGLKVLSYNFENQKTEYQTVLQTFSNYAEKYIEIHTETEQLKVTGAHLFYIPSDKKWIVASQLKLDMQLIDSKQNLVAIKKLEIIKEKVQTYNLEVAQNHNYYVGEQQSILTHNDSKKLKFTSEIIYQFNFYEYYDVDNKPTYVGQTTQELTKRADQHTQDYKNILKKAVYWG
ncbi:hypothetical protein H9X57_14110 [Flavobacterium piscinae]|uniref:polymorphic toxin-type HINT domain-containing protein n=1 Tax=Flavobacterium piscinae TaxID=2506424 RepID=UPI0019C5051D|nr:polymorphic toxin-type HINT domain-containing protein [Flavobacterium piscinae]MBC8884060.1 hypothetical protein [Flavobacterium piscinae]